MEDIESMNTMELIAELRKTGQQPQSSNVSYVCGKASEHMRWLQEELDTALAEIKQKAAHQGEWLSVSDPLLKRLWGEYRQRTADTEMEVLVMIVGGVTATTAFFDGEDFIDGVDMIPVRCWMPLPAPPKEVV